MRLTKNDIANLPPGTYKDDKQRGLILKVTESSRRYAMYCWINGSPVKRSLGPVDDMKLEEARDEVARLIRELRGAPLTRRHTLGEVADLYVELSRQRQHRTSYMEEVVRQSWERWRGTPLDAITPLMVQSAHNEIVKKRGPQAGRRALLALRTLFNYAVKMQMTTRNPAACVDPLPPPSRDVFLTEAELSVMRECLDEMSPKSRHFFLLALLTGLRRSNVAGLRRSWVSLENATITVPAEFSKNKKPMTIPLIPEALEIVQQRMAVEGEYLFSGKSGGAMVSMDSWVTELRMRMRVRGVTKQWYIHDLRRTAATRLLAGGTPMPIISALLGHISLGSAKVYARADVEMVRAALMRSG